MTNVEKARSMIADVCRLGVRDFCACSGSRNAPLLAVLGASPDLRVYSFVDERSAAFFALGRAKLTGNPAAVVTTSGTAVAELLPAAIEAHYSGLPLVFITADRPERYRGTGAPQAIHQADLLGRYAATSLEAWDGASALHLNVEFDEPLIDGAVEPVLRNESVGSPLIRPSATFSPTGAGEKDLETFDCRSSCIEPPRPAERGAGGRRPGEGPLSAPTRQDARIEFRRPVVVIGELRRGDREMVREFVVRLGAPTFAEPLSGLREDPPLHDLLLTAGERILARGGFDGVCRIGAVPTLRFWRDLDESLSALPVVSYSALHFRGLGRGDVWPLDVLRTLEVTPGNRDESLFALDREIRVRFEKILDEEPQSELAMFRALSREVPAGGRIYLGNSLPIREWGLAAAREDRQFVVAANRGANGIDGQLSTFFGQCDPAVENVAVVGDLTALYDLNAPWIVPQLDPEMRFRIVVVNNRGGRIFERVGSLKALSADSRARVIDNVHDLRFDSWASMFGIGSHVRELRPDLDASRRVWQKYEALWA
jgi:2-succinyl-5-enolpyruvyl-6-hydroxy-3-cyclohexene-1-carboxylate synthase